VASQALFLKANQFWHHLARFSAKLFPINSPRIPPQHKPPSGAKSGLEDRYHGPVLLEEVAKAMYYSTFYFCKLFKKATGITFTDFLNRVRVEKAKNLLENPHLCVNEAAFEVGFQSLPHFNRLFRKIVGVSPTEFREKLRIQRGAA
jgi:AraC-like DNA-binding protein